MGQPPRTAWQERLDLPVHCGGSGSARIGDQTLHAGLPRVSRSPAPRHGSASLWGASIATSRGCSRLVVTDGRPSVRNGCSEPETSCSLMALVLGKVEEQGLPLGPLGIGGWRGICPGAFLSGRCPRSRRPVSSVSACNPSQIPTPPPRGWVGDVTLSWECGRQVASNCQPPRAHWSCAGRGGRRGAPRPAFLASTASSPSGVRPRALAVPGTRQNIPVWASACAVPCAGVPVRRGRRRPLPTLRSLVAAGRRCFKGDITRLRKARRVELRALGVSGAPLGSGFPPPWGHGPHMSPEDTAMAEGSELTNRLMSENADLKKQVRLMKENQMLKRLLSESCQESCGRGGRGLLMPKAPACPEACSAGSAAVRLGVRCFPFLLEAIELLPVLQQDARAAPGTSVVGSPPGVHRMPAATLSKQAHVEGGTITHQPPARSFLRGTPSARWLMRHWSQGLVCTGATVKSHLPRATLSPFIPRIELCQGLPSGLRAIHAVSWGQACWALPQSPPHRAGRVGCGRGAGPRSGWAVPRHTPSRPGVSGTVASTPPVGRPRSCRTAVLGGAAAPGQPAATRPSTERPWSPSCRAWAPAILRVTSMPRVQPSAEGAALALGLDLENQQEFLRAAQGNTRYPKAGPEPLAPLPEAAAVSVYSASP
ncbi:hypothetical protein J1605_003657 [Eschrichtius robustus]|uniref:Speriolin N-terminal domain-containing protein n=1 Tax=Eschrichtius robustus TaxID=9764 RepID=A0AB34HQA2_ESCRO|nr:hypothetical protein J1605_003657 [Eschrichtius robustus]